jgi:hypothetical protein
MVSPTKFRSIIIASAWGCVAAFGFAEISMAQREPTDFSDRCARDLTVFVERLDRLLESDPTSVLPFRELFRRTFPVSGCDPEKIDAVVRKSANFVSRSEMKALVGFHFKRGDFRVSFAIVKATRKTAYPSVRLLCGGKDCL